MRYARLFLPSRIASRLAARKESRASLPCPSSPNTKRPLLHSGLPALHPIESSMRSLVDKENMSQEDRKTVLRKTRSEYRKLGRLLEDKKADILRPGDQLLGQVSTL